VGESYYTVVSTGNKSTNAGSGSHLRRVGNLSEKLVGEPSGGCKSGTRLIKVLQQVDYPALDLRFLQARGSRVTSRGLESRRGELGLGDERAGSDRARNCPGSSHDLAGSTAC
jgi:hypothetical protein